GPEHCREDILNRRCPVPFGYSLRWAFQSQNDGAIGEIASRSKVRYPVQDKRPACRKACRLMIGIECAPSDLASSRQPAQAVRQLGANTGDIVEGQGAVVLCRCNEVSIVTRRL